MSAKRTGRKSLPSKSMPQLSQPRPRRKSSSPRKADPAILADSDDGRLPVLEKDADPVSPAETRPKRNRKSVTRFSVGDGDSQAAEKSTLLVKDRFPDDRRMNAGRAAAQPLLKRKLRDDDEDLEDDRDEDYVPRDDDKSSSEDDMEVEDAVEQGVSSIKPKKKYKLKSRIYSRKSMERRKAQQKAYRERVKLNGESNKRTYKKKEKVHRDLTTPRNREDITVQLREREKINYSKLKTSAVEPTRIVEHTKWTLKHKRALEVALRSHHPDDIDHIAQYLPNKTKAEIEAYITFLKNRTMYPEYKESVPEFVAPIDKWTALCDDLARGHTDFAEYLGRLMTMCGDLVKGQSGARPVSSSSTVRKPDYSALYRYLSDILDRKKPPELGSYESAILVDLLQTLANTISGADVTSQTAVMTRKFSLLSGAEGGEKDWPTGRVDKAREGWSFPPALDEMDSAVHTFKMSESMWNNHSYSDDSFTWPDFLLPLVKRTKGRLSADKESAIEDRLIARENQLQCFSLNPFGVTRSILRLNKADDSSHAT